MCGGVPGSGGLGGGNVGVKVHLMPEGSGSGGSASGVAWSRGGPAVITTQPSGAEGPEVAAAVYAVSEVVERILHSKKTEDCSEGCHQGCASGCRADCCCPSCGCPEGECGCGSCGSCLCTTWDMFCTGGRGAAREEIRRYVIELEQQFGPVVLLMAERRCGLSLDQKAREGSSLTRQEKHDLHEACERAKQCVGQKMAACSREDLGKVHENCCSILAGISGLGDAIEEACLRPGQSVKLPSGLKIVDRNGNSVSTKEENMAKHFLDPGCFSSLEGNPPGIFTMCKIYMLLVAALTALCKEGRVWLTGEEVQAIVIILLAMEGYTVKSGRGQPQHSLDPILMSDLGKKVQAAGTCFGSRNVRRLSLDSTSSLQFDSPDGRGCDCPDAGGSGGGEAAVLLQRVLFGPGAGEGSSGALEEQWRFLQESSQGGLNLMQQLLEGGWETDT